MWLFYYFNSEMNYNVLKSKSPCILLNKNINFNKSKTESKMKNSTRTLRNEPCASAHFRITNKSKTVMSRSSQIFLIFVFIPLYSLLINFQNNHTFGKKTPLLPKLFACF